MVTKVLIDYLSESDNIEKKKEYIKNLRLKYSDLIELKQIFRDSESLYSVLHEFTYYRDSNFIGKIDYQDRKRRNRVKLKKMRRYK